MASLEKCCPLIVSADAVTLRDQEYILADVRDRQHVITLHKKAQKTGMDLTRYNQLKDQMLKTERQLRKLRNPLRLQVPPKTPPVAVAEPEQTSTPTDKKAQPEQQAVAQALSNTMGKIEKS